MTLIGERNSHGFLEKESAPDAFIEKPAGLKGLLVSS